MYTYIFEGVTRCVYTRLRCLHPGASGKERADVQELLARRNKNNSFTFPTIHELRNALCL